MKGGLALSSPAPWKLKMTGPGPGGSLQPLEVGDLFLVLGYERT